MSYLYEELWSWYLQAGVEVPGPQSGEGKPGAQAEYLAMSAVSVRH